MPTIARQQGQMPMDFSYQMTPLRSEGVRRMEGYLSEQRLASIEKKLQAVGHSF